MNPEPVLPRGRDEAFAVAAFRRFYATVLRLKREVLANPWGMASGAHTTDEDAGVRAAAAQRVSDVLYAALERLALDAGRHAGEYGTAQFREAQYLMATLADEVFLHLSWEGRGAWGGNLLETRFFGTHVGGDRFFGLMEALLREHDPVRRPLGAVCLLALSVGFQGRYRGTPAGPARLEEYRRQLFAYVYPRHRSLRRGERGLTEGAYENALTGGEPPALPPARAWIAAAAVLAMLAVGASHVVWTGATAEVRRTVARIDSIGEN
jgi:type VI secretion system protein ImpK